MITLLLCLLTMPVLAQDTPPTAPPTTAQAPVVAPTRVVAGLTLRVEDREAALQQAVALAEARGGWFSALHDDGATLRVPTQDADTVLQELRDLGEMADRRYSATDLGAPIVDLETRLAARQKVLGRYLEVLETASSKAIVSVEREISGLVAEIENLQGQLRLLRDHVAYAQITVDFRFRERQAPVRDGSSSFEWLNSLNVADLLSDLEYGNRGDRSRAIAVAPAGFAPFDKTNRFQAISPDDVAYRVRSVRHDPQADLAFWTEALRNRMVAAGYHLQSEQQLTTADGTPGIVLELGAANGARDQSYLVGLFVSGRRLILVEATGQADRFSARRDAIHSAIGLLQL